MAEDVGNGLIELRTLGREAVGAVSLELVGKIAAGDKHAARVQGISRLGNGLAEEAVVGVAQA